MQLSEAFVNVLTPAPLFFIFCGVLLGVFVISQIIEDVLNKEVPIQQQGGKLTELMPSAGDVSKHGPNALLSSLIGR